MRCSRQQTAQSSADAGALQAALASALSHEGELHALDEELSVAKDVLAAVSIASAPAEPDAPRVIELSIDDLSAATDQFAEERVVGTGGFGTVYAADAPVAIMHLSK